MPLRYKRDRRIEVDIDGDILELSQKTSKEAIDLAVQNAPVLTGAYRAGLHMSEPDKTGWTITGQVDHSIYVEFKWSHRTLNNSVEKALTDNGVELD